MNINYSGISINYILNVSSYSNMLLNNLIRKVYWHWYLIIYKEKEVKYGKWKWVYWVYTCIEKEIINKYWEWVNIWEGRSVCEREKQGKRYRERGETQRGMCEAWMWELDDIWVSMSEWVFEYLEWRYDRVCDAFVWCRERWIYIYIYIYMCVCVVCV